MTEEEKKKEFEEFCASLLRSRIGAMAVATHLHLKGYSVRVPQPKLPPNYETRMQYVDKGDVFATWEENSEIRVEVKWWETNTFTCLADFPHPLAFVCKAYVWDHAEIKPSLFCFVNPELTAMAVLRCSTYREWTLHTYENKKSHRNETVYRCAKGLLEFRVLDTDLTKKGVNHNGKEKEQTETQAAS